MNSPDNGLSSILSKFGSPLIRNNSKSSLSKISPDEYHEMNAHEALYNNVKYSNFDDNQDFPLLIDDVDDIVPSSQRRQLNTISLMRRLGHVLATITVIALVVTIPILTYYGIEGDALQEDNVVYVSAGAFAIITVLISFRELYMHLTNFYMPDVQKYVVRIMFMVPVYSVQSWLSLRFFNDRIFLDTIRDLYEAYVIASFVYLLIELLGGENALAAILDRKDEHYGEHPFPLNYFMEPWKMGEQYLFECKYGALQYVVIKVLSAILIAILEPLGLYGEGSFKLQYGYIYISLVINVSQSWALYALVKILHATHHDLVSPVNWNPLGKAACVKGVVFFTYWQGLVIAILQGQGIIHDIGMWDADHVSVSLQDYLIIVEMFFFAVAHTYTFSYHEFLRRPDRTDENGINFTDQDFYNDSVHADVNERALSAPMRISKALWKSSVPGETIYDINRLKSGISNVMSQPIGIIMNIQDAESI